MEKLRGQEYPVGGGRSTVGGGRSTPQSTPTHRRIDDDKVGAQTEVQHAPEVIVAEEKSRQQRRLRRDRALSAQVRW